MRSGMRRAFCGSAVVLACALATVVRGEDAPAITLDAAVQLALDHNQDLRAASARVTAAEGQARQARLWPNPAFEAASEDWPAGNGGGFSASKRLLGLSQTIPFPGKKSLDGRIGASGARLSRAQLSLRRLEVVRDVKVAFYSVLAAERLADASRELARVAGSSASAARKRVEAGAAPLQEQLRAEVVRAQAQAALRGREGELIAARRELATLLGRPDLADASVTGALAESIAEPEPATPGDLDTHPVVAEASAARERADFESRRARLDAYPDLTGTFATGRVGIENQAVVQAGLSITLPLFDRGQGRRQETRANLEAAEAGLAASRQRLRLAWNAASNRLRTATDQVITHREQILPRAEEALRLVRIGFTEGKLGFIDLIDTQRTLAEARQAYIERILEMNVARVELEALTGDSRAFGLATGDRSPLAPGAEGVRQ